MQNANVPLQRIPHYHLTKYLATYYIECLAKLWQMSFYSKIVVIQMIMLSILILDYHYCGRPIVISYRG